MFIYLADIRLLVLLAIAIYLFIARSLAAFRFASFRLVLGVARKEGEGEGGRLGF